MESALSIKAGGEPRRASRYYAGHMNCCHRTVIMDLSEMMCSYGHASKREIQLFSHSRALIVPPHTCTDSFYTAVFLDLPCHRTAADCVCASSDKVIEA